MKWLLFILIIFTTACMHFSPIYRAVPTSLAEVQIRPSTDFVFEIESPGQLNPKKITLTDGLEYRAFNLLEFNRVIGFIEQRNQFQETGILLREEYQLKLETYNKILTEFKDTTEDYNSAELNRVILSYLTTIFGSTTLISILFLVILL